MKIAYLILCHKNPEQVKNLIEQLNMENVDFFVHIDKKANFNSISGDYENVFYLPNESRVDVRWATMSMITATLSLVRYMISFNKKYDYVFLLSGQDFPIKNNESIMAFLNKNDGLNYIQVLDHSDAMYKRYQKRNKLFYPQWMFSRKNFVRIIKRFYIYVTGGYNYTFPIFSRRSKVKFEYGSQWWGLKYECLKWIVGYIDDNPSFLPFFENSLTPDECVFQTVFMMSPFKEKRADKQTFLIWGKDNNSPRNLLSSDINMLLNQKELFARKFDSSADDKVITLIAEALKEG